MRGAAAWEMCGRRAWLLESTLARAAISRSTASTSLNWDAMCRGVFPICGKERESAREREREREREWEKENERQTRRQRQRDRETEGKSKSGSERKR